MYLEQELARERHRGQLAQASRSREARKVVKLRKARRLEHRAERQLLRAWSRAEQLRSALETR
jgi:energy-coupling factor transporter transmembrane protein EcfT